MTFNATLEWTFGLINSAGGYLTAEAFGGQINATGTSLRKKQTFTLLQEEGKDYVCIKTPTGKFLSADPKGVLSATASSIDADEKWRIEALPDGVVTLASAHGGYLGGSGTSLSASARQPGATEKWTLRLAAHPQVCLRNIGRRAYVHLEDNQLHCNELVPWGDDAMVLLEFHNGRYAIRASNGLYLHREGRLVPDVSPDTLFALEFYESKVAFKASTGKYLQGYGPQGILQERKSSVGKDELFDMEDSHPQVTLRAHNGRYVSNQQTQELKADLPGDEPVVDDGIFQLEMAGEKVAVRNHKNMYWGLTAHQTLSADQPKLNDRCWLTIEWRDGGRVAMKASNGKYVQVKLNGQLAAASGAVDDKCLMVMELINRPKLVLRSPYGYLAVRKKDRVVCNASEPDVLTLESRDGQYAIKGPNGKYWRMDADGIAADGARVTLLDLSLVGNSHIALKYNGVYLTCEQQGGVQFKAAAAGPNEFLEF